MHNKYFNAADGLKNDEILRLRDGVLYVEKKSYRQNRFFLIRLWTNSQYDENRILSQLVLLAQITNHIAKKELYLNTADLLLQKLKPEINARLYRSSLMRWFKGTPCIRFIFFQGAIEVMKKNIENQKPQPRPQPQPKPTVPPVDVSHITPDTEIPKETLIALMKESLTKCLIEKHKITLRKWIKVTKNQEDLLKETKRIYQEQWQSEGHSEDVSLDYMVKNKLHYPFSDRLDNYVVRKTSLLLHSDQNKAYPVISNAPQNYARAYLSVREKPAELANFYKKVFKGFNGCLEGNDREIGEWFAEKLLTDPSLQAALEIKTKTQTLGDLDQLRIEFKMRQYFKQLNNRDFKPKDEKDEEFKENYLKNGTPEIQAFRDAEETKEGLIKFIQESNRLPIKTKEGDITADNLNESIDQYYLAVYGE